MTFAILFGGSSYEHEISIVSAITLKKVLKKSGLQFIFVDAGREFWLIEPEKMKSKTFSSGEYKKGRKLTLEHGGFFTVGGGLLGGKKKKVEFDVLLNVIHGRDGEDGKIAGIMEFFGIPFIGPRLEASVCSYSKLDTKLLAEALGIATLEYRLLVKGGERRVDLDFPLIVKPVHLGSSIGVSVVRGSEEFDYALDVAFEFDDQVLVEPFVEGIVEYNLAGCRSSVWELSLVEEPQKEEFLDFDKKYMDFSRDEKVHEAVIDAGLKEELEGAFKKIYDPLFLGSLIRCDFFVIDGKVHLNEINPVPGSMAHYLFDDYESMLERLAAHLPRERSIPIDYRYIDRIQKAKGKA
ncbi:D-alanine--D-alanine ligase [Nitratifractor sp.]